MIQIDRSRRLQIFDLGGVIIDVDARKTLEAFGALGMPRIESKISNSHAIGGVFSQYCDGEVTTAEFIAGVRETCKIGMATDEEIRASWNAMLGGFRAEAIEQVRVLRREGYTTALLSNCNELHTEYCRAHFPGPGRLDDLFDAVFFSQEIHVSKPERRAWQIVLDHFGAKGEDAAFYDDSDINVAAACGMGISGVIVGK